MYQGAVRDRAADPDDTAGGGGERAEVPVRGHGAGAQPHLDHLHHDEPGLRRPLRAARQPQGPLPLRRHDGARLRAHRRDLPLLRRLRERARPRHQDRRHVQALLRAALLAAPLRLRHARRQVGADGVGQPEAEVCGGGRVHHHFARHQGRQLAQVLGAGRAAVRGHHFGSVPGRQVARA